MHDDEIMDKIDAYMAIHQRLGSMGNGDFDTIAKKIGIEEKLGYPLHEAKGPVGEAIEIYDIPQVEKEKILRAMYPFQPVPSMDEIMFDIHEEKTFTVKDFMVIRDHNLNFLVSPYFCSSGGSVLDWISRQKDNEDDEDEDDDGGGVNAIVDLKTIV